MLSYHGGLHRAHKERLARIAAAAYRPPPVFIRIVDHTPDHEEVEVIRVETTVKPRVDAIQKYICDYYGVRMELLTGVHKTPPMLMRARQIAVYLCYEIRPDRSLPQIGKAFNRDHSTVVHCVNKFRALYNNSPADYEELNEHFMALYPEYFRSAPVSKLRVASTEPNLATLRDALPHEEPETGAGL